MPATILRSAQLLPFILGLLILAISLMAMAHMVTHDRETMRFRTESAFDNYIDQVRQVIEQRQQTLRESATMIASRNYLERAEFDMFANSLVGFYPDLLSLSWAPFLTEEEVTVFIERALVDGIDNLHLQPLPDDPSLTAVRENRHIIDDFYIFPRDKALKNNYIGLMQHPSAINAYIRAFKEQRPIASQPLLMEGDAADKARLVLVYPVYGVEDALHGAEGVLIAVLSYQQLFQNTFNRLDLEEAQLVINDVTDGGRYLAYPDARRPTELIQSSDHFLHKTQIPIFGRAIRIEASMLDTPGRSHWLILIMGVLLASWTTLALRGQQQAKSLLQKRVREKTQEMEIANRRAVLAADSAKMGIWEYDLISGELIWDDWMFRIYQVDKATFDNSFDCWKRMVHPGDLATIERELEQAISGQKPYNTEFRIITASGEIRTLMATAQLNYDEQGKPIKMIGVNRDVSDQKRKDASIWKQANFDDLTGLPNRKLFKELLSQEIRLAHRHGNQLFVLYLDLDGFKEINDTLGHAAGDELLCLVSMRIRELLRDSDEVSRLGGDEFAIILSDIESFNFAADVATKLIEAIALPYKLGQHEVFISTSMGISNYPRDTTDADDLLKYADQSMYVAKYGGKNRFAFFTQALHNASVARMEIATSLRHAIENREFELYYQPIFELSSGKLKKTEALIRWMHQEKGLISPAAFVPIAEETGAINDMGAWIFEEAFNTLQDWLPHLDDDFEISINMSPTQLRVSNEKYDHWLATLAEKGLQGGNITIEITEGLLLKNEPLVNQRLLKYRDAGVKVAIDDFGTGYSSLAYLKEFDIDYLKIDQSFTRNLHSDSTERSVSEAIIVMAHRLGLLVIAEGVETEEQRDMLKSMGCDFAQGYLYARPLTRAMFEQEYIQPRKKAGETA